jgi:hypothetical protein
VLDGYPDDANDPDGGDDRSGRHGYARDDDSNDARHGWFNAKSAVGE